MERGNSFSPFFIGYIFLMKIYIAATVKKSFWQARLRGHKYHDQAGLHVRLCIGTKTTCYIAHDVEKSDPEHFLIG